MEEPIQTKAPEAVDLCMFVIVTILTISVHINIAIGFLYSSIIHLSVGIQRISSLLKQVLFGPEFVVMKTDKENLSHTIQVIYDKDTY